MLDSSAHIPRCRRFACRLATTHARLAERHGMAHSFAAEDFHLLPIHQLAGRSGMRAGLLLKGDTRPRKSGLIGPRAARKSLDEVGDRPCSRIYVNHQDLLTTKRRDRQGLLTTSPGSFDHPGRWYGHHLLHPREGSSDGLPGGALRGDPGSHPPLAGGTQPAPHRWRHGSVAADGAALHRGGGGGRA